MSIEEHISMLEAYFDLMAKNGGSRIYRTAKDLNIFDTLQKNSMSAQDLAKQLDFCDKPLELLLEALCTIGALDKDGDLFMLSPVMQLLTGSYGNLGDEYWDHLPQLLKTGNPVVKMDSPEQSEDQYKNQVTALGWMMKPAAEKAAQMLDIGKSRRPAHILDVGAGSGIWSLTFAQKSENTTVSALDWPQVLEITKAFAKNMGLEDRLESLPGNYHELALPDTAFDLVIAGNVTHLDTFEANILFFHKLHKTVKPGGEIVIFDIMPGQKQGETATALYALGLALRTEKGQVHSVEKLTDMLKQIGFNDIAFYPIKVTPYTMGMIVAKKEGATRKQASL